MQRHTYEWRVTFFFNELGNILYCFLDVWPSTVVSLDFSHVAEPCWTLLKQFWSPIVSVEFRSNHTRSRFLRDKSVRKSISAEIWSDIGPDDDSYLEIPKEKGWKHQKNTKIISLGKASHCELVLSVASRFFIKGHILKRPSDDVKADSLGQRTYRKSLVSGLNDHASCL